MSKIIFDSGITLDDFFAGNNRSPVNPMGGVSGKIHQWMLMGMFLVFASSCEDDGDNPNTFRDSRDRNVYKTVTIGNQVWMAENLKYLPTVSGPDVGSVTTPYYYVYEYNDTVVKDAKATANYKTYGVLYNWVAATTACPAGWHLPGDNEWIELREYLGGELEAGGKLKDAGTRYWDSPNTGATNETGFTALPGGLRHNNEEFHNIGTYALWWSSSQDIPRNDASFWIIFSAQGYLSYDDGRKETGLAVRCVRDKARTDVD